VWDFFAEYFLSDISARSALGDDDYSVFEGFLDDGHPGHCFGDEPFAFGDGKDYLRLDDVLVFGFCHSGGRDIQSRTKQTDS